MQNSQLKQNAYDRSQFCDILACEQALWSGKELRKGKSEENKGENERRDGKGVPRPLPQSALGSLRSLIYFDAFSPPRKPVDSFAISLLIQQRIHTALLLQAHELL